MSTKEILRKSFAQIRNSIDKNTRYKESAEISDIITSSLVYKSAKTVFIYVSFGSEVETHTLIDKAIQDGKRVAVPLCDRDARTMNAYEIKCRAMLERGTYNILEPKKNLIKNGDIRRVVPSEIDLAIVPAYVYDKKGARIGYGGGYYDRFLSQFCGVSLGVAFSQCIVDALQTEEHDVLVDKIVCPEGMIEDGEFICKR